MASHAVQGGGKGQIVRRLSLMNKNARVSVLSADGLPLMPTKFYRAKSWKQQKGALYMITFVNGNIFKSPCHALVNPVNCVGVMGAGLAKQFKERYLGYYMYYKDQCSKGNIRVGEVDIYGPVVLNNQYLISFPTKDHFKDPSELSWISRGLASLMVKCRDKDIESIAIPPLGCGLGGLNWEEVKELIVGASMANPTIDVKVYVPQEKIGQWRQ